METKYEDEDNEKTGGNVVNFEDILLQIGEFGRYQKIWYIVAVLPAFCVPFAPMMTIFTMAKQDHRCALPTPWWDNDTFAIQNEGHALALNTTIPRIITESGDVVLSECKMYVDGGNGSNVTGGLTEASCDRWVYDTSQYETTVISDFNLVCDRKSLKSHAVMIFFGGVVGGSFLMGAIGDKFGRRIMLCLGITLLFVAHFSVAWVHDYEAHVVLRFVVGMGNIGYWNGAMVLGMEMVAPSKRKLTGLCIEIVWCVGEGMLLVAAYFIRDWRTLQICLAVPIAAFLPYWFFLPESPRWLLSKGRHEEAFAIIRKAAETNKVKLAEDDLECMIQQIPRKNKTSIFEIFSSRTLVLRAFVIFFNWLSVSFAYMGLSLYVGNLGGNVYTNFLFSILVEVVAYLICIGLLDRTGRKPLYATSMLVGGVACLLTICTTQFGGASLQWLTIALSMIGKLGSSAAYAAIYVYTTELFPTPVRSRILGVCELIAKMGAMVSPYVCDLGLLFGCRFSQTLPLVVFGSVTFLAGLASLSLPETLGHPLPESFDDAVTIGRRNTRPSVKRTEATFL
ncbi:hypothetical protein ScPMuIL_017333 [Solemya velum]